MTGVSVAVSISIIAAGVFLVGFWLGRLVELIRWQDGTGLIRPEDDKK